MRSATARALAAGVMLLLAGHAQGDSFSPASFLPGEQSLLEVLVIPESPGLVEYQAFVLCHARIRQDGGVQNPLCLKDPDVQKHRRFREAVLQALETARFQPASINSRRVEVFASFMVAFNCDVSACNAIATMHWGQHVDRFGMNYVLPQDVVSDYDWFEEYAAESGVFERPDRRFFASGHRTLTNNSRVVTDNRTVACSDCWEGFGFLVSLLVDEQGVATDLVIEDIGYAGRPFAKAGRRAIAKSSFIPGFADGHPTAMRHSLFMYYFMDQPPN